MHTLHASMHARAHTNISAPGSQLLPVLYLGASSVLREALMKTSEQGFDWLQQDGKADGKQTIFPHTTKIKLAIMIYGREWWTLNGVIRRVNI